MVADQKPADHAFDVADLISRLRLERPAILGASYGGAVALELALRHPHCVGSLVITGAEAAFRPNIGGAILLRALEHLPLPRTSPFLNQFFNVLHGCRPTPSPVVEFVIDRCWETDQAVVASRLRALEGFDLNERLWEIDTPTLLLAGSKDVVVPPSRQRALASALPEGSFDLIEGAGHIGFLTHRSEVASKVVKFLRQAVASFC